MLFTEKNSILAIVHTNLQNKNGQTPPGLDSDQGSPQKHHTLPADVLPNASEDLCHTNTLPLLWGPAQVLLNSHKASPMVFIGLKVLLPLRHTKKICCAAAGGVEGFDL